MAGLQSMTGFATREGWVHGLRWRWEVKSVNARGLDLRVRAPDGFDGLEPKVRAAAQARFQRGSVTAGLRVERDAAKAAFRVNPDALAAALDAALAVQEAADLRGLSTRPPSVDGLMALRGVLEGGEAEPDAEARALLEAELVAGFEAAADALAEARAAEGARLSAVLEDQVARIEAGARAAEAAAAAQAGAAGGVLRERVAALMAAGAEVDETRLAQELALLAVKGDVREEIDRLRVHVAGARELLAAGGAVGRRLDFLTQEFNREANTICSKASSTELTHVGLELKAVIDQMREQVQNIE